MKKISIVIPTYNEEKNVKPLVEAIESHFSENLKDYDYEILFIDNLSQDSTREKIRGICACNKRVKAIFNARNFGQFNSPYHALLQQTGDCAILMCADFQDPVYMISEFVHAWEQGHKIVVGQKSSSKESKSVYFFRSVYYGLIKKYSSADFIEHYTGFGLYDRSFIEVLRSIDDPIPYLRGIVAEMGYGVKVIEYEQQKRKAGKSSNNFFSLYDVGATTLTTYTKVGVRIFIVLGLVLTALFGISLISLLVYWLISNGSYNPGDLPLFLGIYLLISVQFLFIGVIGEYILTINRRMLKRPLVIEEERINFD